MYIIQTQQDLNVLKKSNVINEDKGYLVLLEHGDNLRNLSVVGLDPDGGMLEAIPEFINTIELEKLTVYEIVVVYNNEYAMTFYLPEEIANEEIKEWIKEYK